MPDVTPTTLDPKASVDERILHPLDRLRGTIRRFVLFDGLLAAGLFVVLWFWVGLAADYGLFRLTGWDWVQDAPWAIRAIALVAAAVLLLLVFLTRVVFRLARQFSYPSLALVLEKRYPAILGDRLITAVELADVRRATEYGYSPALIRQTIAEARDRVAEVPLRGVFDWGRLRRKGFVLAGVAVGVLALAFLAYGALNRSLSPVAFSGRFGDVVGIAAERNVLLQNTPWPRRAHLEYVNFPGTELRVGKDAPPPRITVRAYQWVVADTATRDGWRPLAWSDLTPDLLGSEAPQAVTLREEGDWKPEHLAQAGVLGGSGLPGERPVVERTVELAKYSVDEVATTIGTAHPDLAAVYTRLDEVAARPAMSRTLRKLDIPEEVVLTYRGKPTQGPDGRMTPGTTRGEQKLTREPNGDFSAEVTGLKESVAIVVRAADYRTGSRDILLLSPPMLTRLTRTESQPAYLYHPAPVAAEGGAPDLQAMKGLRQVLPEKDLSLTGDRSLFSVPVGTDLVLTGTTDKPLAKVEILPKVGRVPGGLPGSSDPVPVAPQTDTFSIRFEGESRITQPVEFDLRMTDTDGIQAVRPVAIQAVDDQAPTVELAVDVLRKVGNAYLCTVRARVPFVKDSIVRDDTGLAQVEYQFTVTRVETQAVLGLQAQAAAGVWAYPPVVSGLGPVVGPAVSAALVGQLGSGEQRQFGALAVPPYERAAERLPRQTADTLRRLLAAPPEDPDRPPVVREVKFNLDTDVFDLSDADTLLEQRGRRMRVADPGDVQPRFRMEVNVVATDANVETGPKQGRSLEPVRLLVVSEADLLAEMSKDEEQQITRLDEALRRLTDAQSKLAQQADRLISQEPPPDTILTARVRADDVIQDVAKGRDLTQGVVTEYARLRREAEVNQVNESVTRRWQGVVIEPLQQVLDQHFKLADEALVNFRNPLAEGRRPDDPTMFAARNNLDQLVNRLRAIRAQLGESLSESKLRDTARKILEQQTQLAGAIANIRKRSLESLFSPEIAPAAPVVATKGEKKKVRHAIDWRVFDKGELKVRVEVPPGSGIVAPAEITVKDDRDDFEYELTAGDKPGDFVIRLIPSVGNPVEVKVTVK